MGEKVKRKGILLMQSHDEDVEIEFELEYLLALSIRERFMLMEQKSREMKNLLYSNGHRKTTEIIKRK